MFQKQIVKCDLDTIQVSKIAEILGTKSELKIEKWREMLAIQFWENKVKPEWAWPASLL